MSLDPTPLLDAARAGRPWHTTEGCQHCERGTHRDVAGLCVSNNDIADLLGVTHWAVSKWRDGTNAIRDRDADRYAAALHLHPWEIWPQLANPDEFTRTCLRDGCTNTFVLTRKDRRYCSKACGDTVYRQRNRERRNERTRRKYAVDAVWREAKLRRRRDDYWTRTRRAELIKQRARDAQRTRRAA